MNVTIIVNPNAGGATDGETVEAIERRAAAQGAELLRSQGSGQATELARQAIKRGAHRIIAAGGDGTINEVVNGMAGKRPCELAIVPMGTANDLARGIGIESENIEAALDLALSAQASTVDAGEAALGDGPPHWFLNVAAGGFAGIASRRIDSAGKERWGSLAYAAAAVGAMRDVERYDLAVHADGQVFEVQAHAIVIANGRFAGGGIPVAPEAQMDDGWFDISLLPVGPLLHSVLGALEVLRGRHGESDRVITFRARHIEVHSNTPLPFTLDGELQQGTLHATFHMHPSAIQLVRSASGAR